MSNLSKDKWKMPEIVSGKNADNKKTGTKIVGFIVGFLLGIFLWIGFFTYPNTDKIIFVGLILTFLVIIAIKLELERKIVIRGIAVALFIPIVFYTLLFGACALGLMSNWH